MMIDGYTMKQALLDDKWKAFIEDKGVERKATVEELVINCNSVNLSLGYRMLKQCRGGIIDPVDGDPADLQWEEVSKTEQGKFLLKPGDFCLGYARERFEVHEPLWIEHASRVHHSQNTELGLPVRFLTYFVPMYEGRSTVGRLGIATHVTAGFGDYGFGSNFTMEIFNVSARPMLLTPEMQIAQLQFEAVTPAVHKVFYQGAYAGRNGGPHPPVIGRKRFMKE